MGSEIALLVIGMGAGLLAAFAYSWWREKGQSRSRSLGPEGMACLKGINYILSKEPDQAIDEFIKAVKLNSETVETYLALGSLYRSKGDFTRAIRIHQGIICRPNINKETMVQALFNLGLDYRHAGLLDRAVATFKELIGKEPKMVQAYEELEALYEELKDWESAYEIQRKIDSLKKSEDRGVLAHLVTEMAKSSLEKGDIKSAKKYFRKALSIDARCVDAYLHFGDLYAQEGKDSKAVEMWKKIMEVAPQMTFLAYDRLEHAFFRMGKVDDLERLLRERSEREKDDLNTRIFLARHLKKKGQLEESSFVLRDIVERWPNARECRKELIEVLLQQGKKDEALEQYSKLLESLSITDRPYLCRMCGYQGEKPFWKCPQCHRWDTMTLWEDPRTHEEGGRAAEAQGSISG
jgi:lipopolysaccharide biosynthesis regulator YciM